MNQVSVTPIEIYRHNHQQNVTESSHDNVRSHASTKKEKSNTNLKSSSHGTYNRSRKGRNRVPWYFRILIIILAIVIAAVILVLLIFLVFQNRTTTTTSTTTVANANPSNTVITSASSAISTGSTVSTSLTNTTTMSTSVTTSSNTTVITTTPVATVTITQNICTANWSGIAMIAQCTNCSTVPIYYQYFYNYTAIATTSFFALSMQRHTDFFAIDDISIVSVAAPSVQLIINGGFETGNISPWYYCNQNGSSNTGVVQTFNFTYNNFTYNPHSGSYFYAGGNIASADYISQTFSTVVGQVYSVSLCVMIANGGAQTNAALFLGI